MEDIVKGLSLILELENIILILGGVLIGVLVGALPGLSSPMAIALLIPFTITLDLSLIHISEPTRPERISYAVFCL